MSCRDRCGAGPGCCADVELVNFDGDVEGGNLLELEPLATWTSDVFDTHLLLAWPLAPAPLPTPGVTPVPGHVVVGWGASAALDPWPLLLQWQESGDGAHWTPTRSTWLPSGRDLAVYPLHTPAVFEHVARARYLRLEVFNPYAEDAQLVKLQAWLKPRDGAVPAHASQRLRTYTWDAGPTPLMPGVALTSPLWTADDLVVGAGVAHPAADDVVAVGTSTVDLHLVVEGAPGSPVRLDLLGDRTPTMLTEVVQWTASVSGGSWPLPALLDAALAGAGAGRLTAAHRFWRVRATNTAEPGPEPELDVPVELRLVVRGGGP